MDVPTAASLFVTTDPAPKASFVITLGFGRKSVRLLTWRSRAQLWSEVFGPIQNHHRG